MVQRLRSQTHERVADAAVPALPTGHPSIWPAMLLRDFHHAWDSACAAAGCPVRLIHDLRRTAVRNLVRTGVLERVVIEVPGHETRSVFDRYDITSPGDLRDAGAKLYEARNATGTITEILANTGTA
jgi:hypothetical protein